MPCSLCKDNGVARTYTHARTTRHRKALMAVMRQRKAAEVAQWNRWSA